jgi:hypothetical protein
VLYYEIPATGKYSLEIRDALYRGREDFVYRVALGEIPYVTSFFPLGTGRGEPTEVTATGWNLPTDRWTSTGSAPTWAQNDATLAIDDWPAMLEVEPNDQPDSAQQLTTPVVVDGRVDRAGDWDVYRFEGKAGELIIAETVARRLGSPVDSVIELIDAAGQRVAANDDFPDRAAALTTHHADSRFVTTLPRDGVYFLRIGDAQSQGGADCAYRLRVGPPRPDFALRVTPSNVNVPVGSVAKVTVHALRRDGFSGAITLDLIDAPPGFALDGAVIPSGKDSIRMTLTAPRVAPEQVVPLELVGRATIDGQVVQHPVEAAEDMTQAFIYHHLVPADQLLATVVRRRFSPPAVKIVNEGVVDVPIGGSVTVRAFSPFRRSLGGEAFFTLDAPPAGLRVSKPIPNATGFTFTLSADETAEPDLRDNLIIDAFVKRTFKRQDGTSQTRDAPIGSLPAIPIRIVKLSL